MDCTHPRPHRPDLPCAWPGCPDGVPQDEVALLEGETGRLRASKRPRVVIESDGGVTLHRRTRTAEGWTWTEVGEPHPEGDVPPGARS